MSYLEKIETYLARQQEGKDQLKATEVTFENIPLMTLSEFSRRNMAFEIYSEILDCKIWLCSNEEMEAQIKKDEPGGLTFTVKVLEALVRLNATPEDLKRIHDAKSVFEGSKIIEEE